MSSVFNLVVFTEVMHDGGAKFAEIANEAYGCHVLNPVSQYGAGCGKSMEREVFVGAINYLDEMRLGMALRRAYGGTSDEERPCFVQIAWSGQHDGGPLTPVSAVHATRK